MSKVLGGCVGAHLSCKSTKKKKGTKSSADNSNANLKKQKPSHWTRTTKPTNKNQNKQNTLPLGNKWRICLLDNSSGRTVLRQQQEKNIFPNSPGTRQNKQFSSRKKKNQQIVISNADVRNINCFCHLTLEISQLTAAADVSRDSANQFLHL